MRNLSLTVGLFLIATTLAAHSLPEREYRKEQLSEVYAEYLSDHTLSPVYFSSEEEINLFIDIAMEMHLDGALTQKLTLERRLKQFLSWDISMAAKYRALNLLDKTVGLDRESQKQLQIIEESILRLDASPELLTMYAQTGLKGPYHINTDELTRIYPQEMKSIASVNMGFYPQDRERLQDLFDFDEVPPDFRGGRYENVPRLFVFCRNNRRYHCLMMMKDKNGDVVRQSNGRMWSLPVSAIARRNRSYDEVGGYTPSGVYTIDSVMPYADQTRVFGEFRRLILNFIPRSYDEQLLKSFLPESSHPYSWWRESVIGRDMGRAHLRIHGAGYRNFNPFARHYPFVKTRGCIGTREGRYGRNNYRDQRVLLDTMMRASGLPARYENETRLYGLLYVVEINNISRHVTLDEMIWYLQRS